MPTYFRVPFQDKNHAKALGACWCLDHELWYAPDGFPAIDAALAEHWPRITPVPPVEVFPGEDRAFGSSIKLAVDLTPTTCWYTNVRSCVEPDDWKRISLGVKLRAGRKCELCGTAANREQDIHLEAHERFDYVDGTQVLKRLVCACSRCHHAIHYGRAEALNEEQAAREHLRQVNGWGEVTLDQHLREANALWKQRSGRQWELDLSIIESAGISVRLPDAGQRAERALHFNKVRPPGSSLDEFLAALGFPG
ncbi:DNA primase [Lysobacter maris]|uniref:DNA primase n=1 Tax=Marilutibacter maris TaxID=1605891 RepID=A0A508B8Y7_9GAMM|nr:DUF5710 domain-containing protein [Lysobacter maris]KAB8198697.1 DNA primase [Lysobacter maris]